MHYCAAKCSHPAVDQCLLLGVDRTYRGHRESDPTRTFGVNTQQWKDPGFIARGLETILNLNRVASFEHIGGSVSQYQPSQGPST